MTASAYPSTPAERTRWILDRRGALNPTNTEVPYAFFSERERAANGTIAEVAAILLTNRECPWKCLMCDLWRNTTTNPVPPGSIPKQIAHALSHLPQASVLKLYNSGSFFDSGAIPKSDWSAIARLCRGFDRVIVECHPRLVAVRVLEFAEKLEGVLEVAMGLETSRPDILEALNKRFSLADYEQAVAFLMRNQIGVRTFLLVPPPFLAEDARLPSVCDSIRFAFDTGSDVVSLIPTRTGNGAFDELAALGSFREPMLSDLEETLEYGIGLKRGRVFADTWDLERFSACAKCAPERVGRIQDMNLSQTLQPEIHCHACAS